MVLLSYDYYFWCLFPNGTNRATVVTAKVVHGVAGIEAKTPRIGRTVLIEGRRPVITIGTDIIEIGITPVARSRKEDTFVFVAIYITGYYHACNAGSVVIIGPFPGTLGTECRPLRHLLPDQSPDNPADSPDFADLRTPPLVGFDHLPDLHPLRPGDLVRGGRLKHSPSHPDIFEEYSSLRGAQLNMTLPLGQIKLRQKISENGTLSKKKGSMKTVEKQLLALPFFLQCSMPLNNKRSP